MIRISQLKIGIEKDSENELKRKITQILKTPYKNILKIEIRKKSIDARKKEKIYYIYEVDVQVPKEEEFIKQRSTQNLILAPIEKYQYIMPGKEPLKTSPIIVGSGPAGLFCAYILAEQGYKPIIMERGEMVKDRVKTIDEFWQTGKLNPNSNVQFGEGGAGTFSDGKLNTLVKDKAFRGKKVFEILVENGAPSEIMYLNKPHIGTDLLREVITNLRNKIISLGGTFHYNTCLTSVSTSGAKITEIEFNQEQTISCETLVLAIGHSARDTINMLMEKGLEMTSKPFAVGIRVEHPQSLINEAQYGNFAPYLPPASYKTAYTTKQNKGVYSFCMCPGGYVVNASSEEGRLAINGMSNYQRDSKNANSALVVTVTPDDFGSTVQAGIEFQRTLEQITYQKGHGKIPIQRYQDFLENKVTEQFGTITPEIKGAYSFANINEILPASICEALKEAIPYFGQKIKDYDNKDVLISAIESRTSSPIKIPRTEMGISNINGLYPCGEGSGYAGGITTAAMDGIKIAEEIIKKYQPIENKIEGNQ